MGLDIQWRRALSAENLKNAVAKHGEKVFEDVAFRKDCLGFRGISACSVFLEELHDVPDWVLCMVAGVGDSGLTEEEKQAIINLARIRYGS